MRRAALVDAAIEVLARDGARGLTFREFRTGYLALLELRLEATRRPELRTVLTERVRRDLDADIAYHLEAGLPGDADTVRLLYLALNWLIVESLTLPGVLAEHDPKDLLALAVERALPRDGT